MSHEILFLAHRIPFPPDRGDKIRSHHILRRLTRIAPVHVATFADDERDLAQEVELATLAHSYRLALRTKPMLVAGLQALASGKPISLHAFYDQTVADYVERLLEERPIGTIFVFSGQMGQYVPPSFAGRVVVDFVDVDSAKFEAYAAKRGGLLGRAYARENRLLRDEEARLAQRSDHSLLISAEEAALFKSRLTQAERASANLGILCNGADSSFFDPAAVCPEPQLQSCPEPRLIFTGQMDYTPNADAVIRAAHRIMPNIRQSWPEASFHVVGRNPTEEVRALEGINGTRVWGSVDDVRPWLKASDIALVALEIGRGVQNKVLEAMAMALPVVLTSPAATGIAATDQRHFMVADSDEELAFAVRRLAADRPLARAMGLDARGFIVDHLSWQSALANLPEIVGARRAVLADAA